MQPSRRSFLLAAARAPRRARRPPVPSSLASSAPAAAATWSCRSFRKTPPCAWAPCATSTSRTSSAGYRTPPKCQATSPRRTAITNNCSKTSSIGAVLVATPEHWHHRMVLDALAAGKDVYVEKPLCQTPEQGVELVAAEKRSKNIVQVGMQRRSYDLYLEGAKVVAAGTLGNVRMVRSWWLNNNLGGGRTSEARRAARLGAVAGPGGEARRARSLPFPQLARVLGLRRRHRRRPGRARL